MNSYDYDTFTPIKKDYKGKAYNAQTYTVAFSEFWKKYNSVDDIVLNLSIPNAENKISMKYVLDGKTIRHKYAHVHCSKRNCSCDHGMWYLNYKIKLNTKRDTEKMLKSFNLDDD